MALHLSLTDALADQLASAVAQGVPIETAAAAAGLDKSTVYTWLSAVRHGHWRDGNPVRSLKTLSRFYDLIQRAQAEWEAKQIAGIAAAAEERNIKTGLQDWRARAWLLNNHPRTRATYHQQNELELTRAEPFQELERARALSDEELLEQLALPPGDPHPPTGGGPAIPTT